MSLHQGVFQTYIAELQKHLFDDMPFEEIIKEVHDSHRKRRFAAMYFLKDRETFTFFFAKRKELGLEGIFNQVIATMLLNAETHHLKKEWVDLLGLQKDMITNEPSTFEVKEMMKDLNSFILYRTKKEMSASVI